MGRNAHRALVAKPEGKKPFGRPMMTVWISKKLHRRMWAGLIWLRKVTSVESSFEL
jgi:hypothetical protein